MHDREAAAVGMNDRVRTDLSLTNQRGSTGVRFVVVGLRGLALHEVRFFLGKYLSSSCLCLIVDVLQGDPLLYRD